LQVRNFSTLVDRSKIQKASAKFGSMLWLIPLVSFMIAWEFVARVGIFPTDRVPAFTTVLVTMYECLMKPDFTLRVLRSFFNLSIGILSAMFLALPLSLVAGLRSRIDLTLTPIIMLIGALPDLALLPLVVMWFGPGNAAAVMMAAICAFFPIYFTVREGAKGIPRDYFHVATVFKAGRFSTTFKVILPSVFPNMVTGLRLSFDFVWEVILAIEIIASVTGIGTFIESSVSAGTVEYALAGILSVGLIALSVDRLLFRTLENRIARWRE
jgi:sulfonate transport system permease protein